MSDRRLGVCLTVVAVAAALTGCGGGAAGSKASGGTAAGGKGATGDAITIKDFKYDPTPLQVKAGQKITVTNEDSSTHTITADDKSFDSKDLMKGQTFSFNAPAKAGKYTYICNIHQYMKGTLEVS